MNFKKRSFCFSLAACALLLSSVVHAQDALDEVMKRKVLRVAVQTDSAPILGATTPQPRSADQAPEERCRVPEFAKKMGHEEKWKLHNGC